MLGWRTVCAVECDPYAAGVLLARQNDGALAAFPIWDDVRTFAGGPWRGRVDVVSGGFPCQDISLAGTGAGLDGARSGLWREYARIVGEIRPRFVCVENSPALASRGLDRVLGDLAALGYDAEWGVLGADAVGAPHRRERIWIVGYLPDADRVGCGPQLQGRSGSHDRGAQAGARPRRREIACNPNQDESANPDPDGRRRQEQRLEECPRLARARWRQPNGLRARRWRPRPMADAERQGPQRQPRRRMHGKGWPSIEPAGRRGARVAARVADSDRERTQIQTERRLAAIEMSECAEWWRAEPDVGRVAHGVAARVDRLRCLGNGQVPLCAAIAFDQLAARAGLSIRGNAYEFAQPKIESKNGANARGERGAAPRATD